MLCWADWADWVDWAASAAARLGAVVRLEAVVSEGLSEGRSFLHRRGVKEKDVP